MEARMGTDERILDILERDSQKGIVLLMEKYTALVWHICSRYVKDPEDIKECVNDIFAEFYLHRKRFNPRKASLPTYLTAIARHRAISRYHKEQREYDRRADISAEELPGDIFQFEQAELRTDMEQAMRALKPNELQIIRMKYYEGMSVREIADSLDLPYETVKKRHLRSVRKLGQNLMLALVLIFILTACVYGVLRYLDVIPPIRLWPWPWQGIEIDGPEEEPDDDTVTGGVQELRLDDTAGEGRESEPEPFAELTEEPFTVNSMDMPPSQARPEIQEEGMGREPAVWEEYAIVPDYGINRNPKEPVYSLKEKEVVENEKCILTLEEAYYINRELTVTVRISLKDDTINNWRGDISDFYVESVTYRDNIWQKNRELSRSVDSHTELSSNYFENVLIQNPEQKIENLSIQFSGGGRISFDMVSVEQENVTEYPHQTGEFGGILAAPRLEGGDLIIGIHPLDDEDGIQIVPGLVRDVGGSAPEKSVTVTGEDGTALEGECIRYRPWGEETYFEWNFGKAKPGRYTLNIPYVYMKADMPKLNIPINLLENSWEDKRYTFPGGSIRIWDCTPIYEKPEGLDDRLWTNSFLTMRNWRLCLRYDSVYPNCPVTGFYGLSCRMERYPADVGSNSEGSDYFVWDYRMTEISNDIENGVLESVLGVNLELVNPENTNIIFSEDGAISFRWNRSFEIPFVLEENN